MASIYGDPHAVAEKAVERELEKSVKALDEARDAARKLIKDAYDKSLYEAERRLRDEYARAEEQLRSLISILELELKSKVADVRTRYIDEVIARAKERIREEKKGADWYRSYMERVLGEIAREAEGEMIVYVAEEDRGLAEEILSRLGGNLRLADEPANIIGGAVAASPDGSTRIDYSLDLLISMEEHRLRGAASKILFKE